MDRERLTELLQDPSQVAKQDLSDLRSLTERFPWFSGAHLLLAVGEHESGDVLANDRRNLPAAFLPSRSVLFDLVHKEEPPEHSSLRIVKDEEPVGESNPVSDPPAALDPGPSATIHPLPAVEQIKVPKPEVTLIPLEEPISAAKKEDVPQAQNADSENDVLDRQIVEAMHSSGYELVKLASIVPPREKLFPKDESIVTSVEPIRSIPQPPAPVQPPIPAPELRAERPTAGPNTRLSFTDWLNQDESPGPEDLASPAPAHPEVVLSSRAAPSSPAPDPLSQQEIMEHFIQHSTPAHTAEKAVFFNPQQAAKRSLLDDGMVSETLARIHEKQGNFAKAREVYDRLAVKHPEKSVYFAALSKALEARSNK